MSVSIFTVLDVLNLNDDVALTNDSVGSFNLSPLPVNGVFV